MARLHVSPIIHQASAFFKKENNSTFERQLANAKSASEIGRVNEFLDIKSRLNWLDNL